MPFYDHLRALVELFPLLYVRSHLFHLSILVDQEDLERKAVGMVKSAKTVVEGVGILQRRVEAEGKAVEPSGFEDGFSLSQ